MKNYRAGFLRSNNFVKYSRHYITILYSYWNIEGYGKLFKKICLIYTIQSECGILEA